MWRYLVLVVLIACLAVFGGCGGGGLDLGGNTSPGTISDDSTVITPPTPEPPAEDGPPAPPVL